MRISIAAAALASKKASGEEPASAQSYRSEQNRAPRPAGKYKDSKSTSSSSENLDKVFDRNKLGLIDIGE